MARFVDREQELAQLGRLAAEERPHFLIVFGRRRLGKTTLLLEFAARSGLPTLYWVASKQSETNLQQSLYKTCSTFLDIPLPPGMVVPTSWDQILILQDILPDLETVVVEGAGHLVHYEKADQVGTDLLDFLNGLDW